MSSVPDWLRNCIGDALHEERDRETSATMAELERLTTDSSLVASVRAAKVYLAAVRCVAAGGSVVFRAADGSEKVLKVRLR
jgi:hypothetical protein